MKHCTSVQKGNLGEFLVKESKLYKLLEALDISMPENITENQNLHKEKNHHIISPSHKISEKCNEQCVDCFSVYCYK